MKSFKLLMISMKKFLLIKDKANSFSGMSFQNLTMITIYTLQITFCKSPDVDFLVFWNFRRKHGKKIIRKLLKNPFKEQLKSLSMLTYRMFENYLLHKYVSFYLLFKDNKVCDKYMIISCKREIKLLTFKENRDF